MCQIFETTRGFVLKPHMLEKQGRLLSIGKEFERIQNGYNGELDICFCRNGGFIVCIPDDFSIEDLVDATAHLADFFETSPRLIDRARLS